MTIDHVTVAGRDLRQMQARLAELGIPSEYGGAHAGGATHMAIASFPDGSYLELIAPIAGGEAMTTHPWVKQMEGDAGPAAWAVRSDDLAAEVAQLRAAGIAVSSPMRGGRARPDGLRLDWETAQIGEELLGAFFPFLIRDMTPREARVFPRGQSSAPNFTGVKRVVIAVRDLKASVERYRQAYGFAAAIEQDDAAFGARLSSFKGAPVVLAESLDTRSWLTERIERFGESPCAFVLGSEMNSAPSQVLTWFDAGELGWHLGVES